VAAPDRLRVIGQLTRWGGHGWSAPTRFLSVSWQFIIRLLLRALLIIDCWLPATFPC